VSHFFIGADTGQTLFYVDSRSIFVGAGVASSWYTFIRTMYRKRVKKRLRVLTGLLDRLGQHVTATGVPALPGKADRNSTGTPAQ